MNAKQEALAVRDYRQTAWSWECASSYRRAVARNTQSLLAATAIENAVRGNTVDPPW